MPAENLADSFPGALAQRAGPAALSQHLLGNAVQEDAPGHVLLPLTKGLH